MAEADEPIKVVDDDEYFDDEGHPLTRFLISEGSDEFIAVGPDNDWAIWHLPHGPDIRVRLDFSGARALVTAVAVLAHPSRAGVPEPISAVELRDVPLGRLEGILNDQRLASAIRFASRRGAFGPGYDYSPTAQTDPWSAWDLPAAPAPKPCYELRGVADTPRPTEFYRDVAVAWSAAIANGKKEPAAVIAEANGVPVSTVHRWVREARRRHVMAPSSRSANAKRRIDAEG